VPECPLKISIRTLAKDRVDDHICRAPNSQFKPLQKLGAQPAEPGVFRIFLPPSDVFDRRSLARISAQQGEL